MSLTTTDKQDIKLMIKDGIETSPIILRMDSRLNKLENNMKLSFNRLEVLNEDMRHKINAVLETISVYSGVSTKVNNHGLRLEEIESKQPIIIKTLALHSKQLGAKS